MFQISWQGYSSQSNWQEEPRKLLPPAAPLKAVESVIDQGEYGEAYAWKLSNGVTPHHGEVREDNTTHLNLISEVFSANQCDRNGSSGSKLKPGDKV